MSDVVVQDFDDRCASGLLLSGRGQWTIEDSVISGDTAIGIYLSPSSATTVVSVSRTAVQVDQLAAFTVSPAWGSVLSLTVQDSELSATACHATVVDLSFDSVVSATVLIQGSTLEGGAKALWLQDGSAPIDIVVRGSVLTACVPGLSNNCVNASAVALEPGSGSVTLANSIFVGGVPSTIDAGASLTAQNNTFLGGGLDVSAWTGGASIDNNYFYVDTGPSLLLSPTLPPGSVTYNAYGDAQTTSIFADGDVDPSNFACDPGVPTTCSAVSDVEGWLTPPGTCLQDTPGPVGSELARAGVRSPRRPAPGAPGSCAQPEGLSPPR